MWMLLFLFCIIAKEGGMSDCEDTINNCLYQSFCSFCHEFCLKMHDALHVS